MARRKSRTARRIKKARKKARKKERIGSTFFFYHFLLEEIATMRIK